MFAVDDVVLRPRAVPEHQTRDARLVANLLKKQKPLLSSRELPHTEKHTYRDSLLIFLSLIDTYKHTHTHRTSRRAKKLYNHSYSRVTISTIVLVCKILVNAIEKMK